MALSLYTSASPLPASHDQPCASLNWRVPRQSAANIGPVNVVKVGSPVANSAKSESSLNGGPNCALVTAALTVSDSPLRASIFTTLPKPVFGSDAVMTRNERPSGDVNGSVNDREPNEKL